MRVRNLVILLVLVGAIAYVVFFQWEWLMRTKESVRMTLAGYNYATTPQDAMDQFAKAIKERDYNAAALYVTDDYASYLRKGQTAAYAIALDIDTLMSLAQDKGINNEKTTYILRCLDPFPTDFSRRSSKALAKMEDKDKREYYIGSFESDYRVPHLRGTDIIGLDLKILRNALMPPVPPPAHNVDLVSPAFNYTVRIVSEGEGDSRIWKLHIPVDEQTKQNIKHLLDNYKKYDNALTWLCNNARVSGGFSSPRDFESHVFGKLAEQD